MSVCAGEPDMVVGKCRQSCYGPLSVRSIRYNTITLAHDHAAALCQAVSEQHYSMPLQ